MISCFCESSMIFAAFIVTFTLWYISFRYSRRSLYNLASKIPKVPNALPFIGHAHHALGNNQSYVEYMEWITDISLQLGGVVGAWIGPTFQVYISNPDDIQMVANASQEKGMYPILKYWLGDGLISAPTHIWKPRRKAINPTFSTKVLDSYIVNYNEKVNILVEKLKSVEEHKRFYVFKLISPCTLDLVCETMMGVSMNAQENPEHPYIKAGGEQQAIVMQRITKPWLQPQILFRMTNLAKRERECVSYLKQFSANVIKARKIQTQLPNEPKDSTKIDDIEHKPRTRKALLDLLLELSATDDRWTDKDIGEEVDNFIIAGNDTIANTTGFTLMLLGARPNVQEKAFNEMYKIFGESSRYATKEDIGQMIYLEYVIKETLRLYPATVTLFRYLDTDVKISNCTLPAKSICQLNVFGVHRYKHIWGDDADEFVPERFQSGKLTPAQSRAYLPFGTGPRNCIGWSYAMTAMKVMISTILRSYQISSDEDIKYPLKSDFVIKSVNGYNISVRSRFPKQ